LVRAGRERGHETKAAVDARRPAGWLGEKQAPACSGHILHRVPNDRQHVDDGSACGSDVGIDALGPVGAVARDADTQHERHAGRMRCGGGVCEGGGVRDLRGMRSIERRGCHERALLKQPRIPLARRHRAAELSTPCLRECCTAEAGLQQRSEARVA